MLVALGFTGLARADDTSITNSDLLQRLEKLAEKATRITHREKIDQFNEKLASMSEHHDVPRIANAGMG